VVSAQHGDLVTEQQDLDVLGCLGASEQRQPAQHAGEHQVRESQGHGERSCWAAFEPWLRGRLVAKAVIRGRDAVLGTHTLVSGVCRVLEPTGTHRYLELRSLSLVVQCGPPKSEVTLVSRTPWSAGRSAARDSWLHPIVSIVQNGGLPASDAR
jgi:hypothetical protein